MMMFFVSWSYKVLPLGVVGLKPAPECEVDPFREEDPAAQHGDDCRVIRVKLSEPFGQDLPKFHVRRTELRPGYTGLKGDRFDGQSH